MKYKIRIDYQTGDDFSSIENSQCLDAEWSDFEIVKRNLKRIQMHYKLYLALKLDGDEDTNASEITLCTDNNTLFQLNPFWCGDFVRLNSATIEMDGPDVKITFDHE